MNFIKKQNYSQANLFFKFPKIGTSMTQFRKTISKDIEINQECLNQTIFKLANTEKFKYLQSPKISINTCTQCYLCERRVITAVLILHTLAPSSALHKQTP